MNRRSVLEFSPGAAGLLLGAEATEDLSWQDLAECQYTDPELFFPEKGNPSGEAKQVCRSCLVRPECLEYALGNGERFGIWGGTSERERRRIKIGRDRAAGIGPGLCRAGRHAMDEGNVLALGDCRRCRSEREARARAQARLERAA